VGVVTFLWCVCLCVCVCDGFLELSLSGVAMSNSGNSSSEFRALEGAASSIALTPCMSSLQAASAAAAMAMDATAAVECAGSSGDTVAGVKDGVPGQQQVGVRKDKVLRARPMRPKRPASEGDGQSSEPVLCSEGVDPLYALSVHAVSGSVCVCVGARVCVCVCV